MSVASAGPGRPRAGRWGKGSAPAADVGDARRSVAAPAPSPGGEGSRLPCACGQLSPGERGRGGGSSASVPSTKLAGAWWLCRRAAGARRVILARPRGRMQSRLGPLLARRGSPCPRGARAAGILAGTPGLARSGLQAGCWAPRCGPSPAYQACGQLPRREPEAECGVEGLLLRLARTNRGVRRLRACRRASPLPPAAGRKQELS